MRRWVAKTLTLALAAGGLQAVGVADPAWACGCGAMIPGSGGTMSVAREQAVVRFDGTTENVVMRFFTQSNVTDAAWVMPVPAQATAKLGDQALFSDLTDAEEPVAAVHHYFWPHIGGSSGNRGVYEGAPAAAPPSAVQVLSDQRIGEFEVANLASSDPKALGDWLNQHSFTLKDSTASRLAAYTSQGWKFVAVRLASGSAADLNGVLDPISLSFPAKSAVYPMRLSAGATTPQNVQVSVLAPHRMDAASSPIAAESTPSAFGDWIDPSKVGPALASLAAGRMFLTVYDGFFSEPSLITQDYAFAPASSDWVQHSTYDKEELLTVLGIPVYLIVLLVLAAGAVLLVRWRWVSVRTRSRATPAPR
ncbi:conserved hypothetical protein [Catenulispora acidiphila DSM 44928]|uniref:DUF2330 domain-containing protein n=1 Tax=Catenulispora acidiphila (strain DSM 44928 / JCM 14897 / NBRC 102108 / NRRL B-24433 / ID139908) TaxID=479433 RepID=C7QAA7_CATAD|nr:DUF2330 domain-containing protein [Catenulispora acidiphila]ACU70505.1 conserved hypothetical protein [Catenulispora acidiphila DSM 44928]